MKAQRPIGFIQPKNNLEEVEHFTDEENKLLLQHIKLPPYEKDLQSRIDYFFNAIMAKDFATASIEEKSSLIFNLIHFSIAHYLHRK